MAQIVIMPKEGITVESCLVGVWKKNVGDPVTEGEPLFEYETDKAAFECVSTASGVLLHRFFEAGEEAPVLTPAAIVGETGEDIAALLSGVGGQTAPVDSGIVETMPSGLSDGEKTVGVNEVATGSRLSTDSIDAMLTRHETVDHAVSEKGSETRECEEILMQENAGQLVASPRARGLAAAQGVDLRTTAGSGPNGRILEADVIAAAGATYGGGATVAETAHSTFQAAMAYAAVPAPEAAMREALEQSPDRQYTDEAFTKIRSVIAKTMMGSLNRSAQLTHHHSFDATNILAMREEFKNSDESLGYRGVSVGDMILYTASRLLARHPEINVLVAEEGVRRYRTVNLGVAVDTPRGLLVPTIFGAEKKSLKEISAELKALAAAAREGRISPDSLAGGTFTISNLGATGVEMFTPIINPPQAAIAGICGVVERVRKGKEGQIEVYPAIGVSLTYDHRAVDGAPASRFAAELCEALTDFSWKTLALELERGV